LYEVPKVQTYDEQQRKMLQTVFFPFSDEIQPGFAQNYPALGT
jgi:hypothetical protein